MGRMSWKRFAGRGAACLLAALICLQLLPLQALAADAVSEVVPETVGSDELSRENSDGNSRFTVSVKRAQRGVSADGSGDAEAYSDAVPDDGDGGVAAYSDMAPDDGSLGLSITFGPKCRTGYSYDKYDRYGNIHDLEDYVEIYYTRDGQTYKAGRFGGDSFANRTVNIPSTDFYMYWLTGRYSSYNYGFDIARITTCDSDFVSGTSASLPAYVEETSDSRDLTSAFDDAHPHGNYGNNVDKWWHYTEPDAPQGATGLSITFGEESRTYSASSDYVEIYYREDGQWYRVAELGGDSFEGRTVTVPSTDFYLHWKTGGYTSDCYGFDIAGISLCYSDIVVQAGGPCSRPSFPVLVTGEGVIESEHSPYGNNVDQWWHYIGPDTSAAGLQLTFGPKCRISYAGDYVRIYYQKDNQWYVTSDFQGYSLANRKVVIPSTEFYLQWYTNGSDADYYGFDIVDISPCSSDVVTGASVKSCSKSSIPFLEETSDKSVIRSDHPIQAKTNQWWHYTESNPSATGLSVTFAADCEMDRSSYDYVEVYYQKDGRWYATERFGGSELAGRTVFVPSTDFYLHWYESSFSYYRYYGFEIADISPCSSEVVTSTKTSQPSIAVFGETSDPADLTSAFDENNQHGRYQADVRRLWHFTGYSDLEDVTWDQWDFYLGDREMPEQQSREPSGGSDGLVNVKIRQDLLSFADFTVPFTPVYKVDARLDGDLVYSDVFAIEMTSGDAGILETKELVLGDDKGIPAGSDVTVSLLYAGPAYGLPDGEAAELTWNALPGGATAVASFALAYDFHNISGYGLTNPFRIEQQASLVLPRTGSVGVYGIVGTGSLMLAAGAAGMYAGRKRKGGSVHA